MVDNRKNIKLDPETFDEFNGLRKELGMDWASFVQTASDAIRAVELDETESPSQDQTLDDLAELIQREHEQTRRSVPEDTANELETRF